MSSQDSSQDELVDIDYEEHVHETPEAHLFVVEDEKVWIPKSQLEHWDPGQNTFTIPEWLAEVKGLL